MKIKKLYSDSQIPQRAYPTDSGLDLCAYIPSGFLELPPLSRILVSTGIAIELPTANVLNALEAVVRSRSGLAAKHGVIVLNSPGTIDNSYRGEIKVILYNSAPENIYFVRHNEKIAQLVIQQILFPFVTVVDELAETERQDKGFGSTGVFL